MRHDNIHIRVANPEDLSAMNHLVEQLDWAHIEWHPEYFQPHGGEPARPVHFWRQWIDYPQADILLALDAGGLVGLATLLIEKDQPLPLLRRAARVVVDHLVVEEAQRGKGIGRALLAACQDWAEAREIFELRLDVYEANAGAIDFYEQYGFEGLKRQYRLRW